MSKTRPPIQARRASRAGQRGSALIEGLLGAMIFAIAAIGALGMIANSARSTSELRARMEAVTLAEDLIGRMQADMGTGNLNAVSAYDDASGTVPAPKAQWLGNVAATLPAGAATVTVSPAFAGGIAADVTVTITWKVAGADARKHTLTAALAPSQ